ncbi:helix-turn-helix domain-containing protein [Yinghuangia soli]|uniref:Helix-turn-helix transcriptional regulator n=1 Tax=Yinghuangia soli TaxID=2908204 RepID=A0AA41U6U8_9ACTN|nr:helix-turn-helix transcriptional regulator [Yinghuangia soli]MCF2533387.1 helix-turn-helix transcriptional regulator [Yinghuangia soli]
MPRKQPAVPAEPPDPADSAEAEAVSGAAVPGAAAPESAGPGAARLAAADSSVAAVVARNVRARRTERGMTLGELAERSGVSRRMLTLIEQGQANPSLGTVERIGRAVGAHFAELVGARTGPGLSLAGPASMITLWTSPAGGYGRMAVTGSGLHRTELWDWLLMPGDRYRAVQDPAGTEELLLVSDGVLVLEFADGRHPVAAGAAARFPADQQYAYVNESDRPVRFARNTLPAPLPAS